MEDLHLFTIYTEEKGSIIVFLKIQESEESVHAYFDIFAPKAANVSRQTFLYSLC